MFAGRGLAGVLTGIQKYLLATMIPTVVAQDILSYAFSLQFVLFDL